MLINITSLQYNRVEDVVFPTLPKLFISVISICSVLAYLIKTQQDRSINEWLRMNELTHPSSCQKPKLFY